MAYVTKWQRLADVLLRLMAAGLSRERAQSDICQAIADGAVKIRALSDRHATNSMTSKTILRGEDLNIPAHLKPKNLDWERSRPVKPWLVQPDSMRVPGYWHLRWIELSEEDVTAVLCSLEMPGAPIQQGATLMPGTSANGAAVESREMTSRSAARPREKVKGAPARPRGPRPQKFERTTEAMRDDICQGRLAVSALRDMFEKHLAARYSVSRDTVRKARNAVLLESSKP